MISFPQLLFAALAYLTGSIPFGLLISKYVKGIDIRQHGSGNVGATNVFRVVGKRWGILVLLLDAAKGWTAVLLPAWFAQTGSSETPLSLVCGIAAILGHSFPVWLNFRGGKGVATSLGVFLALAPAPTLISFGLWWMVFLLFRIISVASLAAALIFPAMILCTFRQSALFSLLLPVSIVLAVFVFYTHRANIMRLLKGEEKRLI